MTVPLNEDTMDNLEICKIAFQIGAVVGIIGAILLAAFFDGRF